MLNFPTATVDGQIFNDRYSSWRWDQSNSRWTIINSSLPTPVPIIFGGTGSSTVSGATINLEVTTNPVSVTSATLEQTVSGFNTNLAINSDLFLRSLVLPGYRHIDPAITAGNFTSGTDAGNAANTFGYTLNYPTTRGFSFRGIGGANANQILNGGTTITAGGGDYTRTIVVSGRFRLGTSTSFPTSAQSFRFSLAQQPSGAAAVVIDTNFPVLNATSTQGFGFRVDGLGPIQLVTRRGNSTTEVSVSSNIFLASNIPVDFMFVSRNGNVSLFINEIFAVSSNTGPTGNNTSNLGFGICTSTSDSAPFSVAYCSVPNSYYE